MATQVQFRGGTTTEHSSFNGAAREVTVDTTKQTLVVQDGTTNGGFPLLGEKNADNVKVNFGNSDDLQLYNDGSSSWIKHDGDGSLYINAAGTSEDIYIRAADNVYIQTQTSDAAIYAIGDGAVEIYYDGDRKFRTTSAGAQVESSTGDTYLNVHSEEDNSSSDAILRAFTESTQADCFLMFGDQDDTHMGGLRYNNATDKLYLTAGDTTLWTLDGSGNFDNNSDTAKLRLGASEDLSLYHNGSHSYIDDTGTGNLYIKSSGLWLRDGSDGGIQNLDGTENHIQWHANGNVELYFDGGTPKLATKSTGAQITGQLQFADGSTASGANKVTFGNNDDLQIFHDATNNRIDTYGKQIDIVNKGADGSVYENMIRCVPDGQIELYYDNVKRLSTNSDGATCAGSGFVKFQIESSNNDACLYLIAAGDHDTDWSIRNDLSETNDLDFRYNNNRRLNLDKDGNLTVTNNVSCVALTETSDIALKTNIEPITNVLDKINQITGYKYDYTKSNSSSMGVIAQDVEKVFPELVHGEEGSKSLQYSGLIGALIESVKELSAKVAALESGS